MRFGAKVRVFQNKVSSLEGKFVGFDQEEELVKVRVGNIDMWVDPDQLEEIVEEPPDEYRGGEPDDPGVQRDMRRCSQPPDPPPATEEPSVDSPAQAQTGIRLGGQIDAIEPGEPVRVPLSDGSLIESVRWSFGPLRQFSVGLLCSGVMPPALNSLVGKSCDIVLIYPPSKTCTPNRTDVETEAEWLARERASNRRELKLLYEERRAQQAWRAEKDLMLQDLRQLNEENLELKKFRREANELIAVLNYQWNSKSFGAKRTS